VSEVWVGGRMGGGMGGWVGGGMGGERVRTRGVYRLSSLVKHEKEEKNYAVFYFAGKRKTFFKKIYIYDVITSPEKEKRSTIHYLCVCLCVCVCVRERERERERETERERSVLTRPLCIAFISILVFRV
jgi:hypothetical protein